MRITWGLAFAGVVLFRGGTPALAQVIAVTDGTFNNTDWSLVVVNNTTAGTPTAGQVASGGNPGAYRSNSLMASGGGSVTTADAFSLRNGFSYTPATQGAITSWTFAVDHHSFAGSQTIGLAVRQGGTLYRTAQLSSSPTMGWGTFSSSSPSNFPFTNASGPGPSSPDFAAGGPIDFGYYVLYAVPAGANFSQTGGVDNFTVSISPVPEPGSLALVGAGLAVGWMVRRRRAAPVTAPEVSHARS